MRMLVIAAALGLAALAESGARAASPAQAGAPAPVAASARIAVDVNGLVCDFCAQALTKLFKKRKEVAAIAVDLDSKVVTLTLAPGATLDDATITSLIAKAGYTTVAIRRVGG